MEEQIKDLTEDLNTMYYPNPHLYFIIIPINIKPL